VPLGRPIMDPPAPQSDWFIELQRGDTRTFLVPGVISDFSQLPRGTYQVVVSVWPLWACVCEWPSHPTTFHIR
jgi:hypothetical protein